MKPFTWTFISSLSLVVVAKSVPSALSYSVNDRAVSVTDAEVKLFDFYAQYAAAGYCNSEAAIGSKIICSDNVCPEVTAAGATVVSTFSGILTDVQGFVSVDDTNKLIVTSFKGSGSIRNWIADLIFIQTPCDLVKGCLLHAGFSTAWLEVANKVVAGVKAAKAAHPSYKIIFTGHSLGAAVATIAAGYVRDKGYNIDIFTYGSPRVGNKAFVEHVSQQAGLEYRVTHVDDPVPRLPPILLNYRHTSPEYWFHTGSSTTSEYTSADAKVCEGYASLGCNGGTFGLDTEAHRYYFQAISACGPDGIEFRKERRDNSSDVTTAHVTFDMATKEPEDLTDEELEAKLNDFVTQDLEYVATLDE